MKKLKITILALGLFMTSIANAQLIGGKKGGDSEMETDGKVVFDNGVQQGRVDARAKLKPYKYDGTKSTYFSYKTYTYAKEVEVLTIEKTDYKLCFNSSMVTADKIKVEIYDKPSTANGRVLLFEKENVGGDQFEVNLDAMNETFRASKKPSASVTADLISQMRLKKIYITYIIPAVDREVVVVTDGGDQDQTTTIQYSAMVVAVGYKFLN